MRGHQAEERGSKKTRPGLPPGGQTELESTSATCCEHCRPALPGAGARLREGDRPGGRDHSAESPYGALAHN